MILRLTQDAYQNGGELRLIENGKETIYVLNNWYEASATDKAGNDYMVYWDDNDGDCDFSKPAMIINLDDNKDINVNDCIIIDVNDDWE